MEGLLSLAEAADRVAQARDERKTQEAQAAEEGWEILNPKTPFYLLYHFLYMVDHSISAACYCAVCHSTVLCVAAALFSRCQCAIHHNTAACCCAILYVSALCHCCSSLCCPSHRSCDALYIHASCRCFAACHVAALYVAAALLVTPLFFMSLRCLSLHCSLCCCAVLYIAAVLFITLLLLVIALFTTLLLLVAALFSLSVLPVAALFITLLLLVAGLLFMLLRCSLRQCCLSLSADIVLAALLAQKDVLFSEPNLSEQFARELLSIVSE